MDSLKYVWTNKFKKFKFAKLIYRVKIWIFLIKITIRFKKTILTFKISLPSQNIEIDHLKLISQIQIFKDLKYNFILY